jgi:pSer/pThr/pTyr-binding forkhead associated (FHA) protein
MAACRNHISKYIAVPVCAAITLVSSGPANAQSPKSGDEASNSRAEDLNGGLYKISVLTYYNYFYRPTVRVTATGVLIREPNMVLTTLLYDVEGNNLYRDVNRMGTSIFVCEQEPDQTRVAAKAREAADKKIETELASKLVRENTDNKGKYDKDNNARGGRNQGGAKSVTPEAEALERLKSSLEERANCIEATVGKIDTDRGLVLLQAQDKLKGGVPTFNTIDPDPGFTVKAYGFPSAADAMMTRRSTADERQRMRLVPSIMSGSVIKTNADKKGDQKVMHQVPVSDGVWGGPLVNNCGDVVGLNVGQPTAMVVKQELTQKSTSSNSAAASLKTVSVPTSNVGVAIGSKEVVAFAELNGYTLPNVSKSCLVTTTTANFMTMWTLAIGGGALLLAAASMVIALRRPGPVRNTVARIFPGMSRTRSENTFEPGYAGGYGSGYGGNSSQPTSDYSPYSPTASPPIETLPVSAPPYARAESKYQAPGPTQIVSDGTEAGGKLIPLDGSPAKVLDARLLSSTGVVVGREPGCDVTIDSSTVSKRHARVSVVGGKLQIDDLGSANGTFRGKTRIQRELFGAGDTVRFGSVEFKIEIAAAPGGATVMIGQPPSWVLSGSDEDGHTVQWPLTPKLDGSGRPVETQWIIGRNADRADKVLSDKRISAEHARVRWTPQRGLEICDLGSSNGTKVDGTKITDQHVVIDNAREIEFGGSKMKLTKT